MTLALVLGGGGLVGIAWETGLLAGLRQAGLDLSRAELIVGTSAGAVVGAQLATGCDLDDLYARQLKPLASPQTPLAVVDLAAFSKAYREAAPTGVMTQSARAHIGALALAAATQSEADHLRAIEALLPIQAWPERRLLLTAVDAGDGSFAVWDKDSRIPLPLAVAASCAVPLLFPPMSIHGRRYMDGGLRSAANADLAQGCDGVIILAPTARLPGQAAPVEAEAGRLRAAGHRVQVIQPDEAAARAFVPNLMDPAARLPAAQSGRAQAAAVLSDLRIAV
jgi:NTE family protein